MYSNDIPGQISEFQMRAIEIVATLVPKDGKVVEVGSLFGKSSYAWAKSTSSTAKIYCLDPWEGNQGIRSIELALGIKYGIDQFKEYTKECENIVPCKGYSPKDFQDWSSPVDLYYEDAVHSNPILRENLDFWSSHVLTTGVICGDDYRPRFPDVVTEVNALAQRLRRELIVVDYFWCLLPNDLNSEIQGVKHKLHQLQAECNYSKACNPFNFTLEATNLPEFLDRDSVNSIRLKFTNESNAIWGEWIKLWSINVKLLSSSDSTSASASIPIEPILFPPDISREFTLDLAVADNSLPGIARVELSVVGPAGSPQRSGRVGSNRKQIEIR